MATISTRLTNAGTLLVNGTIDEVTFNTTAGNAAIYNQFSNSQIYGGTNWVLSSTSITPNVAIAPDGSNTATMLMALNAYPTLTDGARGNPKFTVNGGDVWTVSGYVKYGNLQYMNIVNEYVSGTGWYTGGTSSRYDLINGTVTKGANVTAAGMISVGNNWWRMYSTYTIPAGVTGWNPQIYRMGQYDGTNYAGNVVYVWGAQLEKNANVSTYQPIASSNILLTPTFTTRTVPDTVYATGQFDEVTYNSTAPVIKNLLWQTQNWTANIQSSANVSVTANSILAPDGTQTGSTITTTVGGYSNDALIQKWNPTGISTAALPYCLSVYVKQGNCPTIGVNLAFYNGNTYQDAILTLTWANLSISTAGGSNTGTVNYGVIDTGLGWYRLWCSATNNYSAVGVVGRIWVRSVYNNNIVGDYNYAWGMQIEQGSSPTIYQGKGASTILTPNFARREDQTGNMYVTNSYDEYTGAPVVDSSLQWWFDGGQTTSYSGSGAQIRNLSNTAQTGTMYGNVTYRSNAGGQFVFNNYLDTTNSITAGNVGYPTSFNDPWTAEAWIFVPTGATWSNGVNKGALYLRGSYAGVHGLMRTTNDNQVGIVLRGNATTQAERYGTTVRNQWNQVVGVWTGGAGGNLQCYVNGTLTQSGTTTQDDPIELAYWLIGGTNGISGASGSVFEGNISGVKLYTRALSADEVAQNFNALRRRYNI